MKDRIVRMVVDLARPRALTKAQKAQLAALDQAPASAIDLGDMPELTEEFWKNAVRGKFYRPVKTSTTVRIDSDVLAWLKSAGKGYQTRINAILRKAMMAWLNDR